MQEPSDGTNATALRVPARAGSAWRRVWAFFLDLILIGTLAKIVGDAFFEPMSDLGEYGRLIGWGLVIAYFAIFDSRWGRRRSIGKRLFGICVVRSDGTCISPVEAGIRA
jgi:uncharacterized RDD family membrane protein YckC